MNEIGGITLALLAIVVAFGPRRWALLGMSAGVLFLTQGQALEVLGLTLYPMRCLELIAFIRVILRRELGALTVNGIDRALLAVYAYTTIVFLLRTALGGGTSEAITQLTTKAKIGLLVDAVLCYFAFRALLVSFGDLVWFLRSFVFLLIPYVVLVSVESVTGDNPFAAVGGQETIWRDVGRMRCSGSFRHPSLLGTFGASFLPLYVGLALIRSNRARALAGLICCFAIVFLADSGGPLMVVALSTVGWALWTMRRQMFILRWTITGVLVLLAIVMKVPLWYLPHKLSALVGGDGWHRSELMNKAVEHFDEWWLAGMSLDRTADWFFYKTMGAVDLTNAYLVFGFDAGVLAIVLFIVLLVRAFRGLGEGLTIARTTSAADRGAEFLLWSLGAVLVGHIGNFLAITYWDQTYVIWFMQLAAMSSGSRAWAHEKAAPALEVTAQWWTVSGSRDDAAGAPAETASVASIRQQVTT